MGFRSVVFDCDSTLCAIEGIDELASDHRDEVRALTDAAMEGRVALEAVYGARLELIRPSRARIEALGSEYCRALVPDAVEVARALRYLQKDVRIVSGGLRPPVEAVAHALGLGSEHVAAVGIRFDRRGEYAGFEVASPLARSGGKEAVLRSWHLPRPVLLVGDGATDLEARPAVDAFVAYMAVVDRPAVAAGADMTLRADSLSPILALASSPEERRRLEDSPWAEVLARGVRILEGADPIPATPSPGDR